MTVVEISTLIRRWIKVEISTSNFQRFFNIFSTPNKKTVEISTSIRRRINVENARWVSSSLQDAKWWKGFIEWISLGKGIFPTDPWATLTKVWRHGGRNNKNKTIDTLGSLYVIYDLLWLKIMLSEFTINTVGVICFTRCIKCNMQTHNTCTCMSVQMYVFIFIDSLQNSKTMTSRSSTEIPTPSHFCNITIVTNHAPKTSMWSLWWL